MVFKRLGLGMTGARVCPLLPPTLNAHLCREGLTMPELLVRFGKQCLTLWATIPTRGYPFTLQYFKQKLAIEYTLVPIGLFCLRGELQ